MKQKASNQKTCVPRFLIRQWGNNWWDIPLWATAVWDWYTGIVLQWWRWWWWWLWWWLWWRRLALGRGIQSQHGKLGARLGRGTSFGRGQPGVSGGRAFRGGRRLGQRRRGMSIQYMGNGGGWPKNKGKKTTKENSKKERGRGGEGIHF